MMNSSSPPVVPVADANAGAGTVEEQHSVPVATSRNQEKEEKQPHHEKAPPPPPPPTTTTTTSPTPTFALTKPKSAAPPQTTKTTADEPKRASSSSSLPPTIHDDGTVSFSLSNVHEHFICSLCAGYYKEPFTLHDCLHTFCKSCLYYSVACGCFECPSCGVFVGKVGNKLFSHYHSLVGDLQCNSNIIFTFNVVFCSFLIHFFGLVYCWKGGS